jgi:anti-sigma B factor antagonist
MTEERITITRDLLNDNFGLIAASGYINNEGGQAIADAATELMNSGAKTLLIDLDGTRIINSIGVSILLEILEKLMDEKGKLAFCNLTPTIAKTFEIMGLVQYATVYPDRDAARAAIDVDASV